PEEIIKELDNIIQIETTIKKKMLKDKVTEDINKWRNLRNNWFKEDKKKLINSQT
ncbi:2131_t:CDS:1, partial [Acaulospora colombiana]